jgi:hypothetical protein
VPKKTNSNSKEENSKSNSKSKNRKNSRSKDRRGSVGGSVSRSAAGSGADGPRASRRDSRRSRPADKLASAENSRLNHRSIRQDSGQSKMRAAERGVENPASAVTPPANIPNKVSFVEIDENHDGQRLDNFLITHLKGVPKAHIYRIIRKGEIRINKGRVKQTTRLAQGDSLRIPPIRLSERSLDELDGQKYSFLGKSILFEDDALLIINKPCGMAVHAGSGITVGVIEALRAYRSDLKYIELVHRLDRETSGVLVLAKKASALKILP